MITINKVLVPQSIGDSKGNLTWKDGKVISYEHGSVVNVYLFHEGEGEEQRAMELTINAPLTYDKCVNAAEMAAYGLETAMDVASFNASLSRKQRVGEDTDDIIEHDNFMDNVKNELSLLGLAPYVVDELTTAKQKKLQELTVYDKSKAVDNFIINRGGVKLIDYWINRDLRTSLKDDVETAAKIGETYDFDVRELGITLTLNCEKFLAALETLRVYAYTTFNTTSRHMAAINALQTVEAVDAYDFTQGYPPHLTFNIEELV